MQDALDKGELKAVLDDFAQETVTFSMRWPASQTSPRLRAFIDYLSANLMVGNQLGRSGWGTSAASREPQDTDQETDGGAEPWPVSG